MKYNFSLGVFFNIRTGALEEIKQEINFIDQLTEVEHLEILCEAKTLEPATEEMIRTLRQRYQIIVHAPFINVPLVGYSTINLASTRLLQKFYDWSLSIGAKVFTIHGGHKPFYQTKETDFNLLTAALVGLKTDPRLQCALENMPVSKTFSTAPLFLTSLNDLEKAVGLLPNFGYTLDIGHVLQNQEEWRDWLKNNIHKLHNIHLHDAFLGGKAHLPLGSADLNCPNFFQFLTKNNYNKFVSLEVVGKKETRQSWTYLRERGLLK